MPDLLLIAARTLQFSSGLILAGVVAFGWLVLLPGFRGQDEDAWQLLTPLLRRFRLILIGAFAILVLSGALIFWNVTAEMSGTSLSESLSPNYLGPVLFQTQFGHVTQWRIGLAVGWIAVFVWCNRSQRSDRTGLAFPEIAMGLIGFALVASLAWMSHAGAGGPWWRVNADAGHLAAASIWPAGLLPFALFLGWAGRLGHAFPLSAIRTTTARFSSVSFGTVGLLVATGTINSCYTLGRVEALFTTEYGRILTLKLCLFSLILGFAAVNRYRLVPLTIGLASGESGDDIRSVLRRLRAFVFVELILALAVIAVVAILGITPPPR